MKKFFVTQKSSYLKTRLRNYYLFPLFDTVYKIGFALYLIIGFLAHEIGVITDYRNEALHNNFINFGNKIFRKGLHISCISHLVKSNKMKFSKHKTSIAAYIYNQAELWYGWYGSILIYQRYLANTEAR